MTFEEFVQYLVERIPDYLLQYDIDTIRVEKMTKNNSVQYTSMVVVLNESNISPNIYLEYYYSLYEHGKPIEEILALIADDYKEAHEKISVIKTDEVLDSIKIENLFLRLVNYEKNKDILNDCPHIMFKDMAITFRCLFEMGKNGIASCLIRNDEMERFGLNVEELYEIARKNTVKLFPPRLDKLVDLLDKYLQDKSEIAKGDGLYVLTNEQGINGATYMIYDEIIKEFAQRINSNIFILPSSVHEVLLLPDDGSIDKEELQDMVMEINRFVVTEMEFLSDNVYYYDADQETVTY